MIQFDNASKNYGSDKPALNAVNFAIARGEMVFLTGHSGAGKTTLLKLILAMERPSTGKVLVNDIDVGNLPRRHIPAHRRRMGVVFQDHQLLNDRNIFDNVALPLEICGFDSRDVQRRVRAALDKVGLLHTEKLLPAKLSGGEQQRVGIARAVVHRPSIILADEPTGNLDPELSADIMAVFGQFQSVGVSLLVASHDRNLLQSFPNRTLTLEAGRLIADSQAS